MRIGIEVSPLCKERSGVGAYLCQLIDAMARLDTTNEYVLYYSTVKENKISGLPWVSCQKFSLHPFPWPRWFLPLVTGFGRWRCPLLENQIGSLDVIHWPNYLLFPRKKGKQILTIYDLSFILFPTFHPWIRTEVYTKSIFRSAKKADLIIVPSDNTKRDVEQHLHIPANKIRVVYGAAGRQFRPGSLEERMPTLSKYQLTEKGYILFVGNIEPRKNLGRVLQAFALLQRWHPMDTTLALAGGQGWRNAEIYQIVKRLNLHHIVRFLGYVSDEDLPSLLNGASLFIYPSLYEGFGLPPLEAMACGVPVVTSNVSSIPEVVGDAALLVNPTSVKELAEAMYRILMNRDLQEDMRSKGLERVKRFSWEETARRTLRIYEEVHTNNVS